MCVCVCVCVFHNFELLRCYVCTIQFLAVLPTRMNKELCYVMLYLIPRNKHVLVQNVRFLNLQISRLYDTVAFCTPREQNSSVYSCATSRVRAAVLICFQYKLFAPHPQPDWGSSEEQQNLERTTPKSNSSVLESKSKLLEHQGN